jgi:tetratricopeptide (TPR) repeat protein
MRGVLERHGGTVEKFIGDAVMAVFGIPTLHEDDALRAVRAAADIRTALDGLNDAVHAERGLRIGVRIGINTGEVVAGDPSTGETLVTGDAVNVAARLEQAAGSGDILIGEGTHRLVRAAVVAQPVNAVVARGKSGPVAAYRLVSVTPNITRDRRWLSPTIVGRAPEIARLTAALEQLVTSNAPQLLTVLGVAGMGKSRLVAEFVRTVEDRVTVLRGHCVPYGEGTTYYPLAELVQTAAGIVDVDDRATALEKLGRIGPRGDQAELVTQALASATGLDPARPHQEEIFWAVRRLLEHLAEERPLVVLFEDIHWAEPTFLDLIEYLADRIVGAPVLLIGLARPELFERRPGWSVGQANASLLRLEALTTGSSHELLDELDGSDALPEPLRDRILDAAEGNPLYIEEMLGMLVDEGHLMQDETGWHAVASLEDVHVPPTIDALLAARIDGLPDGERDVAERASVVGRVFEAAAIRELVLEGSTDEVGHNLMALVRKELIRPERAELSAGDAYKFRHVLIRDAAYHALPKLDRAELHERFAGWLGRVAGDRVISYEEILGFHLEQAHAYRSELGLQDERTRDLAVRARRWLASAGNRARQRRDVRASMALLGRAISLVPEEDPEFASLALAYVDGLFSAGELGEVAEWLDRIDAQEPLAAVDAAEARLDRLGLRNELGGDVTVSEARHELACILRPLVRGGRKSAVVEAWQTLGGMYQNGGDIARAEAAYRKAARWAAKWGVSDSEVTILLFLASLGARSRMPAPEAIELARRALEFPGVTKAHRADAFETLAYLFAMETRFDEAREYLRQSESESEFVELGHIGYVGQIALTRGLIERFARNPEAAVSAFRFAYDYHVKQGAGGIRPFLAARLGQALLDAGRIDEARAFIDEAERVQGRHIWTGSIVGGARARLLGHDGRAAEGLALAREVVTRGRTSGLDGLAILLGNTLEDLAACAMADGDHEAARGALEEALQVYEAKGDRADAAHVRGELADARRLVGQRDR